jgi:hypothetical protein
MYSIWAGAAPKAANTGSTMTRGPRRHLETGEPGIDGARRERDRDRERPHGRQYGAESSLDP